VGREDLDFPLTVMITLKKNKSLLSGCAAVDDLWWGQCGTTLIPQGRHLEWLCLIGIGPRHISPARCVDSAYRPAHASGKFIRASR
jgi:hypothetical protein